MEKLNIKQVLGDKIILKQLGGVEKVGVLYVPESSQQKPAAGIVMARGNGTVDYPIMYTAVGDEVSYNAYATGKVIIEGEEYIIVREQELYFIK